MADKGGKKGKSFNFVHETEDGLVHLEVRKSPPRCWTARFWGREVEGYMRAKSFTTARETLLRCFADMYPQHCCTAHCGPEAHGETHRRP
jgi:hypothetical protein